MSGLRSRRSGRELVDLLAKIGFQMLVRLETLCCKSDPLESVAELPSAYSAVALVVVSTS